MDGHNATAIELLGRHLRSEHLRLLRLLLLLILALQSLLVLAVALRSFILVLNRLVLLGVLLLLLVLSLGSGCEDLVGWACYVSTWVKGNDELFGSHFIRVQVRIRLGVRWARSTIRFK